MKLFVDTNVLLDVLARRIPWVQDSAALLSRIDTGPVRGFVAAHTFPTLHYLLSKYQGREKASAVLVELIDIVEIVPVDRSIIQEGFALGWRDFEDALQAACALRIGVDYFVTRNPRDFAALSIPVVSPPEVLYYLPP